MICFENHSQNKLNHSHIAWIECVLFRQWVPTECPDNFEKQQQKTLTQCCMERKKAKEVKHGITESQYCMGWKEPLEIKKSNLPNKARVVSNTKQTNKNKNKKTKTKTLSLFPRLAFWLQVSSFSSEFLLRTRRILLLFAIGWNLIFYMLRLLCVNFLADAPHIEKHTWKKKKTTTHTQNSIHREIEYDLRTYQKHCLVNN